MSASSAKQDRRLQRAVDRADTTVKADAAFFGRFPHRSHRVRPASASEIEANAAVMGVAELPTVPGRRWFVAVRQIAPGVRVRAFVQNDADIEWEMGEADARQVYEFIAPGKAAGVEAKLRAALAKRGRL